MKITLCGIIIVNVFLLTAVSCNSSIENQVDNTSYRFRLMDSLFNSAVKNNEIPGAAVYIMKGGKVAFHKAYGYRNIENKSMLSKDDIFRMASMTKGLTAVGILQLYERGLLFLDDNVSDYIPEFNNPTILLDVLPDSSFTSKPANHQITIRQLLTHTSGIGYGFQDERYNKLIIKNNISEGFEDDNRNSYDNIARLAKLPLLFEPGEKYTYGLSYDVLGVLIEKITGLRYDAYIHQNILAPLGMNSSYFIVPQSEQWRLVKAYQPTSDGKSLESTTYADTAYPVIENRHFFSGGADLCSTAEDYAKFVEMLKNKGIYNGKRILGSRYVDIMLAKQTKFEDGGSYQGFAAWITTEKGAAEGPMSIDSFGFGGFWDTYAWTDPKLDFTAVLLLQMYPNNQHRIHQKFMSITYGMVDELE